MDHAIGPLHDPVTRYKITHAGVQVAQWDFQNNATRTSPPGPTFVSEVLLRNLLTSMRDFVPCDRIVQKTYKYHIRALRPRHSMRQIAATRRRDRLLQQIASCDM